jgi:23S rRNA pseudouridine1911/1915/1917 synthase
MITPQDCELLETPAGQLWRGRWPDDAAPERVDRALVEALADHLPDLTRSRLKFLVEAGQVALNGVTVREPGRKIKGGEAFELSLPTPVAAVPEAQAIDLVVLYEDADLIVIDKPAGLVVHPAAGNPDHTLVNALIAHCGESLLGIGGERRPGIVHRLDKDTSGVMVAAKTERALNGLAVQFADHSIERAYHALVWGVPRTASGTIDQPIGRNPANRKTMAVVASGKRAVTHYRLIANRHDCALIECRLETGRTHQIRVHLSHLGHPLVGDPAYGRKRAGGGPLREAGLALGRQALHAKLLGFEHPGTGAFLRFQTPLPYDFHTVCVGLGLSVPEEALANTDEIA